MMTQTHMLVGAALFAKPGHYIRNSAAIAGGIVPDIAIFVMYGWERMKGTPAREIWDEVYFNSAFWKAATAYGNSAPLYGLMMAAGLVLRQRAPLAGTAIMILGAASLAHIAADFFLHVDDAHAHLYPLSDWRFRSPVSYWDPARYGNIWAPIEVAIGVVLAIILFRRFSGLFARILLGLTIAAYLAVPLYFTLTLHPDGDHTHQSMVETDAAPRG
ncbi:MAG: cobalamin biosynthesis protein CobQ [Pseudomonadota bacterium]